MPAAPAKSAGPLPRVLIVEDERRMRELLLDVIPHMGFSTRAVRSAEDALDAIKTEAAEILLLDLHLPGMSGLDLLARLREDGRRVEAIIMTAYGDLAAAQQAIRHGIADFLTKPSALGDIEAALDRARARLAAPPFPAAHDLPYPAHAALPLAESERLQILAALQRHDGNRTAAALELGISRRTLHYKLRAYRLEGHDVD